MFLPWSFFTLNLFFLVLEISVAASFAAVLAHISRRYGGYVQSIRWIKQAGYWEMVTALRLSVRNVRIVAWRPLLSLLATLIGSIALTGILVGGKTSVTSSTGERNPSREVATSTQFLDGNFMRELTAWSFPVQYETSIEDILARALNNTKANPRASPTKRYRPRISDYEVACDRLDVRINETLFLPNDGCATFSIYPATSLNFSTTTSYILQTSKGRAKAVLPLRAYEPMLPGMVADISLFTRVKYRDQYPCSISEKSGGILNATRVAFTASPTTVLTKCQLLSGQLVIVSTTTIRFAVPNRQMFHSIATSIFGDQDELVSAMYDSVNNGALTDFLADELARMFVVEVKIVGAQLTALICVGSKQPGNTAPHIICAYTTSNTLITKPRPLNPDIAQIMSNKNLTTDSTFINTMMTLTHVPLVSENTPSYALSKILNASSVAVTYMAYLGQNFIMDWDSSTMYVAYDTVDIVEGYDVPGWVFFLMVAVMIACFLFWAATESWVEDRYKRSLYWLVSKSLAPPEDNDVLPLLHRFDPDNLEFFKGRRIVSTKVLQDSEKRDSGV